MILHVVIRYEIYNLRLTLTDNCFVNPSVNAKAGYYDELIILFHYSKDLICEV